MGMYEAWTVICHKCGNQESSTPHATYQKAIEQFKSSGWLIDDIGGIDLCIVCQPLIPLPINERDTPQ